MSDALDFLRSRSPRLREVDDDTLTQFAAERYPVLLEKDPALSERYQSLMGEQSLTPEDPRLQRQADLQAQMKAARTPSAGDRFMQGVGAVGGALETTENVLQDWTVKPLGAALNELSNVGRGVARDVRLGNFSSYPNINAALSGRDLGPSPGGIPGTILDEVGATLPLITTAQMAAPRLAAAVGEAAAVPVAFGGQSFAQALAASDDPVQAYKSGALGMLLPAAGMVGAKAAGQMLARLGAMEGATIAPAVAKSVEFTASQTAQNATAIIADSQEFARLYAEDPEKAYHLAAEYIGMNLALGAKDLLNIPAGQVPSAMELARAVREHVPDLLRQHADARARMEADPRVSGRPGERLPASPSPLGGERAGVRGDRAGIEAAPPELVIEPPVIKESLTTEPSLTPVGSPIPAPETTTSFDPAHIPVRELPVASIRLSKDVPNFKADADPQTGVVAGQKLEGKYERLGTPPVVVWRRMDGRLEIITGRHRLDLARRSGEKTIPAQVVEEARGFTKEQAMTFDAAANIRDGQGRVEDYADFFRHTTSLTQADAESGGLLSRAKGRAGWDIGRAAADDLYALYKAGKVSETQAVAIARAAPGDAATQQVGAKYALAGKPADFISNVLKAAQSEAGIRGTTLDLFGADDSAMREMEQRAERASAIQKDITEQIRAVQGAAKRPEVARKLGVDVADPEGVQKRVEQLKEESVRWQNWPLHEDLRAQVAGKAAKSFTLGQPESIAQQQARVAAEEQTATASKAKEKMAEEAAAPLQGTTGDLGQGDLLGAPTDLFAPPSPSPKGTSGTGRPSVSALPAPPPGTATGTHSATGLPVHMDRTLPGLIDNPTVMAALENVLRAIGSQVPIRTGRFYQNALGIYKGFTETIRLRQSDDIPTAAHEVAHAFSDVIFGSTKSRPLIAAVGHAGVVKELRGLGRALYGSRRPNAGYTAEGFSELTRLWLTTEDAARVAPQATAWFERTLLPAHPEMAQALHAARDQVDLWRGQGAKGRAEAQMKEPPGHLARLKETLQKHLGRQAQVEEFEPLRELSAGFNKTSGRRLPPDRDPFLLATAKRGSTGAVMETMVERGMVDIWGNITGPGLKEALARVEPGQAKDFAYYLWARRALERWGKGKNPGMAREDAQYLKTSLETPAFVDAASKWYQWWDGVLEYVKQANPTSNAATIEAIRAGSHDYVPLARVLDPLRGKGESAGGSGGGLKHMRGSGLPIKNLYQQSLLVAEGMISKAHKDMVLDSVFKLASEEGMGWLVEKVPRTRVMEAVNIEKIRKQLEDAGVDTTNIGPDELLEFVSHKDTPTGTDPIMVRQTPAGPEWYQVPARVYDLMQGMDPARLGPLMDLFVAMPNRAFKLGTTGLRASFSLVTNPLRDLPSFMMQSLAGNPASRAGAYLSSLFDIVRAGVGGKESPEWQAFKQLGIGSGMFLGGDIQHARREARSLFRGKFFRRIASPVETLREVLSFTEAAPRLAEMRLVGKEFGWRPGAPMTPEQAIAMTVAAKRITTDFSAAGSSGKMWNQVMPFYNASIQGTRAFLRAFRRDQGIKEEPHRALYTVLKGASLLTLPALYNWWQNKDKDWYQQLPWRERYLYTNVETESGEIVQVPRPPEWGNAFMVVPEMLMDSWYRHDPESATRGLEHLFSTQMPLSLPSTLATARQQWENEISFFNRPIVPRSQEDLPPGEQRAYFSSKLSVALGNAFPNHVSPRRVDAAVRSLLGGVGGDVMDAPGELMKLLGLEEQKQGREFELADVPVAGRLFRRGGEFSGNNRYLADFWDEYLRTQAVRRAEAMHRRDGTQPVMALDARELGYARLLGLYHKVVKFQLDVAGRTADPAARSKLYQSAANTARQALQAKPKPLQP